MWILGRYQYHLNYILQSFSLVLLKRLQGMGAVRESYPTQAAHYCLALSARKNCPAIQNLYYYQQGIGL